MNRRAFLAGCTGLALGACGHSSVRSTPTTTPASTTSVAPIPTGAPTTVTTAMTTEPATTTTVGTRTKSVLLFSRTTGYRHDSIPAAVNTLQLRAQRANAVAVATEDPAIMTDAELARFGSVVFVMTTGDILDDHQQAALERFVGAGGGFAGIHSASDTEYDWPWYGELIGAWFLQHPAIQPAVVRVEQQAHPSTTMLPAEWSRTDEWYDFRRNPRDDVEVLLTIDAGSYTGTTMGADHPVAWWHRRLGGTAWYTAMGHTVESWADSLFVEHVWGGITSTMPPH